MAAENHTDTPRETYTMLRMTVNIFFDLHELLVDKYGYRLCDSLDRGLASNTPIEFGARG